MLPLNVATTLIQSSSIAVCISNVAFDLHAHCVISIYMISVHDCGEWSKKYLNLSDGQQILTVATKDTQCKQDKINDMPTRQPTVLYISFASDMLKITQMWLYVNIYTGIIYRYIQIELAHIPRNNSSSPTR